MMKTEIIKGEKGGAIINWHDAVVYCPICEHMQDAEPFIEKLQHAKGVTAKKKCGGCKRVLQFTSCILGDLVLWEFVKEVKK